MKKPKVISPEIEEKITYLAHSFSNILELHEAEEDLAQDLRIVYIEKYRPEIPVREWFIIFKNYLIDRHRKVKLKRERYNKFIQNYKKNRRLYGKDNLQRFKNLPY